MTKASNTDWNRVSNLKDKQIDTSDIPELEDSFFNNAEQRMPSILDVVHSTAEDLHAAGVMSDATRKEFDELCDHSMASTPQSAAERTKPTTDHE